MIIQVNITRVDLLKMNVGQLFSWPTIPWIGFLFIVVSYPMLFGNNRSPHELWIVLLSCLITTIAIFLGFWVFIVAYSIFAMSRGRGVLGQHSFSINPDSFIEETPTNTTRTLWKGIYSLKKTRAGIYVKIAPHLVHIIPKNSFKNDAEYNQFFDALNWHRENA
jgi:hypothetical protein